MDLTPYCEDIEQRIDEHTEEDLLQQWIAFTEGTIDTEIFVPKRKTTSEPGVQWPPISKNDALDDFDKMMLRQLKSCSDSLQQGHGGLLNVRADYGTGILSSVFGAELFVMDEGLNTLPTTRPLEGRLEALKPLIDAGVPDIHNGLGDRTLKMGRYFNDLFAKYPKMHKYIYVYHPDLQGPIDICELLLGSAFFTEILSSPDVLKQGLELITETYITFMHEWRRIVPHDGPDGYTTHYAMLHKGGVLVRDDSAMNLSPDMFTEFIYPYDQRILNEFGGGAIHFCGRGDHWVPVASQMDGLCGFNMTQPELNDMETIYQHTVDKGLKLLAMKRWAADEALARGRALHGNVHC